MTGVPRVQQVPAPAEGQALGHPRLSNAPVLEAVLELRGRIGQSFSLIPGRFAAAVVAEYPQATETELARLGVLVEPPIEAGLMVTHQFRAQDGKRLVQLGPGGISVNTLAYTGFGEFRRSISAALDTYIELAALQSIARIGLRYLNRVPNEGTELLSGFTVQVAWPVLPGGKPAAFAARMLLTYDDPPGHLGAAIAQPSPGATLDLDFFIQPDKLLPRHEILAWVDKAHDRIYEAFTALVAPSLLQSWK